LLTTTKKMIKRSWQCLRVGLSWSWSQGALAGKGEREVVEQQEEKRWL